jgi:hypothetical protein
MKRRSHRLARRARFAQLAVLLAAVSYVGSSALPAYAAGSVLVAGTIDGTDPTFVHLANHSCTLSSGETTHYDAIQFFTVGQNATTISVSMTPSGFTGAVFLYQGGFLPGTPIANCYDTASSVVGTTSGGTLSFSTNFGGLPDPFTEELWTLVVTTDLASSSGGSYSAIISSSQTGVELPSAVDTTPPTVIPPANQVAEATGPTGAVVSYPPATATDLVDGSLTPTCLPASGSTFPLGTTTVTCSATDAAGNTGSATFTVTVQDTTAPTYAAAPNIVVDATDPGGAVVTFATPVASDAVGVTSNTCVPPSGSTFAIGTTTVTCNAGDAAGNTGTTTFTVKVLSAVDQIADLNTQLQLISPPPKLGSSLTGKLAAAQQAAEAGDVQAACAILQAFINEVQAQAGKKLSVADANSLVAAATQIQTVLGC